MVMIDTSAWIELLREKGSPAAKVVVGDTLQRGDAVYSDPILFELLAGATKKQESYIRSILGHCHYIPFTRGHWERSAAVDQALRKQGLKLPNGDVFIATVTAEAHARLLCRDNHFDKMVATGIFSFPVTQLL